MGKGPRSLPFVTPSSGLKGLGSLPFDPLHHPLPLCPLPPPSPPTLPDPSLKLPP